MRKHWEDIPDLLDRGKQTIDYMRNRGYRVSALNIVYFQGLDPDLATINNDRGKWDGVRAVIGIDGKVYLSGLASTKNSKGTSIVAGQYLDAWCIGSHKFDRHTALVQCAPIKVFRDGMTIETGHFGLNQHTTSFEKSANAYDSRGGLVGQSPELHHQIFLPMCRSMGLWRFDTTIIDGSDFIKVSKKWAL